MCVCIVFTVNVSFLISDCCIVCYTSDCNYSVVTSDIICKLKRQFMNVYKSSTERYRIKNMDNRGIFKYETSYL